MSNSPQHPWSRRTFVQATAGTAAGVTAAPYLHSAAADRPNILWLTWEDIGPHLHCCGDGYSTTPAMDLLAQRGCIYDNAWASAPVCAPARTAIISGVYPNSTGGEHMRSMTRMPAGWKMFPGYMRDAGYYCTNNGKEDYNLEKPEGTWDVSVETALSIASSTGAQNGPFAAANGHWRNRRPGQPFFAVFNDLTTHESQIFQSVRNQHFVHDPGKAWIPGFEPDTPEARRDWAQYHDQLTLEDTHFKTLLDQLDQDRLTDSTIIVATSDHGCGMPRYKRMPYDSGLHVPMIVVFPEQYRHLAPKDYQPGGHSSRLLGTVDLAPTMLSLIGVKPPDFHQGRAFAGHYEAAPRNYIYGGRGRMDERPDLIRSTRDRRYIYIRNYNPHKIYGQHVTYAWNLRSTQVWEQLYKDSKLQPPYTRFWETKPPEELYDLQEDHAETQNLAGSAAHKAILDRFRAAHRKHENEIKDVSLLPEGEMHARARQSSPYEMGHDPKQYDFGRVLAAADLASSLEAGQTAELEANMRDGDSAIRYWGVMGVLMRGADEVAKAREVVETCLGDASPYVKIAAAEALGRYGSDADVRKAMPLLIELANPEKSNAYIAIQALNAIDAMGGKASPWKQEIAALPELDPKSPARVNREYTGYLLAWLKQTL
jgi:uncharacterized sulfatase